MKRAEGRGQKFETWLNSAGKKMFLSWFARAASRGIASEPNVEPVPPVARHGDSSSVRVGDLFSASVSQLSSSPCGAAGYPLSQSRRGEPTPDVSGGASGSTGLTRPVLNMSVQDLVRILNNVGLTESLGNQNTSQ